jgi:predicted acyltransferase
MLWITCGGVVFLRLDEAVQTPLTSAIARQLDDVPRAGFHFSDLIHPLFLFVVGVAMPLSFQRRLARLSKAILWKHSLKMATESVRALDDLTTHYSITAWTS